MPSNQNVGNDAPEISQQSLRAIIGIAMVIILCCALLAFTKIPPSVHDIGWLEFAGPDQTRIISSSGEELSIWNIDSREIIEMRDAGASVTEIDSSPNNEIAIGMMDGRIEVIDGTNLTDLYILNQGQEVSAIFWSQSGKIMASTSSDGYLYLWENSTLKKKWGGHDDWVFSVSISLDDRYIASSSEDRTFRVFNISDESVILDRELTDDRVTDAEWSPTRNDLAYVTQNGDVLVINPFSNETLFENSSSEGFSYIHWSPDGKILYVAGGSSFKAWDMQNHELIFDKESPKAGYEGIALSFDGRIATISGSLNIVLWSPEGTQITSMPDRTIPPLFYAIAIVGILGFILILAESERTRKRYSKLKKYIYGHQKLLPVQLFQFLLTGIFLVFLFVYINSILFGDMFLVFWFFLFFFASTFIMMVLITPQSLMIDDKEICLPISWIDENIRGRRRFLHFEEIQKIHPDYTYSWQEGSLKKNKLHVITLSGEDYKIFPSGAKDLGLGIEPIEKALAKEMGTRFSEVYDERPKIDFERWMSVRHVLGTSFRATVIESVLIAVIPFILLSYLLFSGIIVSLNTVMFFVLIFLMISTLGMLFGVGRIVRYNDAMGLYHQIQLYNRLNPKDAVSIPMGVAPADKFDPEDYLRTSNEEWEMIRKKIGTEKVWVGLLWMSFVPFTLGLLGMMLYDYQLFGLIFLIGIGLMLSSMKIGFDIQAMRSKIQRAAKYELETGKEILPRPYNIPDSHFLNPRFIIREPMELTKEEQIDVERFFSESDMSLAIRITIVMIGIIGSIIIVTFFLRLPYGWNIFVAIGIMGMLLILFMRKPMKIGRTVQKYKAIQGYKEAIERRNNRSQ